MTVYQGQDRGTLSDYDRYFAAMDKTMQQKLAFTAAHFLMHPQAVIADMGCGSGLGAYQMAQLNPDVTIIGIDINPEAVRLATENYKLPNLLFKVGDVEKPDASFGRFDGILNSSVLHHVYSFNDYNKANVINALRNQMALLKTGGTMIIRDFCAEADDSYVQLELSGIGGGDTVLTMSDADLLIVFSETAQALRAETSRGFFLEEVECPRQGFRRFRLSAKWANEFILRKDYRSDWESETLEEYSWWTAEDFRRELSALGSRVVYTAPFWNNWIIENRYRDRVFLYDEQGAALPYPPTNFIAVVEKVTDGQSLSFGESAIAKGQKGFLKLQAWQKKDGGIPYEMAVRKGRVTDCFPYCLGRDGRIFISAKQGYPRPLMNIVPRGSANLDGKKWSGHALEPIAVVTEDGGFMKLLTERTGLADGDFGTPATALRYYPSSGMMDEIVDSVFIPLKEDRTDTLFSLPPELTGFRSGGEVRMFPAQDILRAAQVGILPEARLEMNIYWLLRHLKMKPDQWLGERVALHRCPAVIAQEMNRLKGEGAAAPYRLVEAPVRYLKHFRSSFGEFARTERLTQQEFEFILPAHASANVVTVLPLALDAQGELCIGLEKIALPAPQLREGGAEIWVIPSYRLPFAVDTLDKAQVFAAQKLAQPQTALHKLGEGYFTSLGLTPERVYPFVLSLQDAPQFEKPLTFVRCRELLRSAPELRDAHLLISLFRAVHMLGLWD
jgi:cyclopropane fatty-acyl-phospholipid synthase-like methyltransferase